MATGIQTGMNRGSRSGLSRNSQLGKGAPGGGGPLEKVKEFFANMGTGTKVGIASVIVLFVVIGIGFAVHSNQNKFVKLYEAKLTENDQKEISTALESLQIKHEIDVVDGIKVNTKDRILAQAKLASLNLPREAVLTPDKVEGGMGKTAAEQKAIRQRLLEGDITLALRQMEGINDAKVKLAIPDKTYFQDDSKAVTARVFLSLKQGFEPNRQQIAGMMSLVSASVAELDKKNVTIIDSRGIELSAKVPLEGDGMMASGTQLEVQAGEEQRLKEKAQETLDAALPGKAKVSVNLEMDFSKTEEKHYTPGSAADEGVVVESQQTTREKLNKGDKDAGTGEGELMTGGGKKPKDGSDYVNEKQATNYKVAEHTKTVVDTGFRIKRLTASVLADNVSDEEKAAIAGYVSRAIGIDESRGDSVFVENLNFQRQDLLSEETGFVATVPAEATQGAMVPSGAQIMALMAVGALGLLGLIGMFLFKQSKVHEGQGTIITSGSSHVTTTSITDHFTEKSGKTTAPTHSAGATQVNTTDELEKLVKERPTKVAEMLKSTWLSQS